MMMVKHVKSTSVVYRIRSAAMAGEFFHLARPIHKYTPEDWKKLGEAEKKAAYKKDKRDKARSAKKERKKAAMGEKAISKVLDEMIFPKIVQCSAVDLQLNARTDDDGWAWAQEMSNAYAQDIPCGCHPGSTSSHGLQRRLDPNLCRALHQ